MPTEQLPPESDPSRSTMVKAEPNRPIDAVLADRLYRKAKAKRWRLPKASFVTTLEASCTKAFSAEEPDPSEVSRYLESLHLEDLALACACALGDGTAWDHFVLEMRPGLYRAADALDPSGGAREQADSLYADLYGVDEKGGSKKSLLRYFHGRSSLATWLRALLSQRHIDDLRRTRRLSPLPEPDEGVPLRAIPPVLEPERPRYLAAVSRALATAVAALAPRDRLRLGAYYAQRLTLAEIGRLLKEHEASVSRHLTRVRGVLREAIEHQLRHVEGMTEAQVVECLRTVLDDPGAITLTGLVGEVTGGKNVGQDRSRK